MTISLILSFAILLLFVLHELEEILFLGGWIEKNTYYLLNRFPRIATKMIRQFKAISTKGFALIALQETMILLLLLSYCLFGERLDWWMGIVLMLTIHWGMTIIQSVILKRIIPGTITAIAGVSFGVCVFYSLGNSVPAATYIKWGVLLFAVAMINLWIMHLLVARAYKFRKKGKV